MELSGKLADGTSMEVHAITESGRKVFKVPDSKWILKDWPELEVECLQCGKPVRFHEFIDSAQTASNSIPIAHSGRCLDIITERRVVKVDDSIAAFYNTPRIDKQNVESAFNDLFETLT